MAMVFKFGKMVHVMKVTGRTIELMVRANLFMLMEMYMMGNGLMIKLMAMVYTIM